MLRIVPYILIWMGGWLIYFPSVNLNPLAGLGTGQGSPPLTAATVRPEYMAPGSLNLWSPRKWIAWSPGSYLALQRASWKPLFWGSGIAMLVVSLLIFYRNKKLEMLQEQQLLQRIRELEQTALRAQMNPHFIFNALNSIQGFIVEGDKKSSSLYLAKFAKLVRSTLQHSTAKRITLAEDIQLLKNYLTLEQLRFQGAFDFYIKIDPAIHPKQKTLPPMLIQPFVENAILHGLAPLRQQGLLSIEIQPEKGGMLVVIKDNGIGITTSKRMKKDQRTTHRSMGMQVTQKRLALMDDLPANQQISINEITDDKGRVAGTEVRLMIYNN